MTCEDAGRLLHKDPRSCTVAEVAAFKNHLSKCKGCQRRLHHIEQEARKVLRRTVGVVGLKAVEKAAETTAEQLHRQHMKDSEYREMMQQIEARKDTN